MDKALLVTKDYDANIYQIRVINPAKDSFSNFKEEFFLIENFKIVKKNTFFHIKGFFKDVISFYDDSWGCTESTDRRLLAKMDDKYNIVDISKKTFLKFFPSTYCRLFFRNGKSSSVLVLKSGKESGLSIPESGVVFKGLGAVEIASSAKL